MLRVSFGTSGVPTWLVSETEFLSNYDELLRNGFAGTPPGRVIVEAVDERQRLKWRAHYTSAAGLAMLAREIREGRAAVARSDRQP